MLTATTATTATRFGALGARGLQLQTAFARGATCPYSSLVVLSQRQSPPAQQTPKHIPTSTQTTGRTSAAPLRCQFTARRHATTASTTTSGPTPTPNSSSSSSSSSSSPSSSSPSGAAEPKLDWNSFFTLRKTRRRFQVVSSIFTMFVGGTAGATLLMNMEMDWLLNKVPMDPFFALGLITLSFAGLGWLAGPVLGSALFHTFKRGVKRPMAVKESEFFARIKKHRVDPSNSSLSGNAVPDFYGEKISSVAGYRQWLKDQRAFNKKRTSFV
ncbi:Pam17-domain-containing protein [Biscogniauxia mediterranea]|nr:Pam17-domain-containing protein [Biscogniauxia mediterranea]